MENSHEPAQDAQLELTIGAPAHPGRFVARHEGRVVFVSDVLPGERVRARVTRDHGRYLEAEALEVLEPSPDRVPHVWAEAGIDRAPEERVGGADYGHATLGAQRELKRRVLVEALTRIGRLPADHPLLAGVVVRGVPGDAARAGLAWRTRVTLHVDEDGRIGQRARRSHRVIPSATLPLAHEDLQSLGVHREAGRAPGRVTLVRPSVGPAREADGSTVLEVVGAREFEVSADGFWQVHRGAAGALTVELAGLLDADEDRGDALDLYGGVGLLAGPLVDAGYRVTSVEADRAASALAERNLRGEAVVVRAPTLGFLRNIEREGGTLAGAVVVLDPPRTGAGKDVIGALARLDPARIVYVACDPVALARDADLLARAGYAPETLDALDLFPHTHHFETVATFRR